MTNMPVLDKNSAAQNILSTKGTKQVSASTKGNFDTVLKQTTEAGRQDTDPGKKAETVKPAEKKTEETDSNKPAAESGRTEEKAKKATVNTETERKSQKRASLREVEGLR